MSDTVCQPYVNFRNNLSKIGLHLISNIAYMRLTSETTYDKNLLEKKIKPIADKFFRQIDSISLNPLSEKIEVRFSHKPFPK